MDRFTREAWSGEWRDMKDGKEGENGKSVEPSQRLGIGNGRRCRGGIEVECAVVYSCMVSSTMR